MKNIPVNPRIKSGINIIWFYMKRGLVDSASDSDVKKNQAAKQKSSLNSKSIKNLNELESNLPEKEPIYKVWGIVFYICVLHYDFPNKIGIKGLCISLDIHHLRSLQQIVIPCNTQEPSSWYIVISVNL